MVSEAKDTHGGIKALLFDFGGVLAEEGFRQGLMAIAGRFGLDPQDFFNTATEIIYACGYVTGKTGESDYWELMRQQTGIRGTDQELTGEILSRFVPRPQMLAHVKKLREKGYLAAILSDQSDWLDRLNEQYDFFRHFDAVYNSYHIGKTKRDPTLFSDTLAHLHINARQTFFVDDNPGNIERAHSVGLETHLFCSQEHYFSDIRSKNLL